MRTSAASTARLADGGKRVGTPHTRCTERSRKNRKKKSATSAQDNTTYPHHVDFFQHLQAKGRGEKGKDCKRWKGQGRCTYW